MVSSGNGENSGGAKESHGTEVKGNVRLHISTSQRGLISEENSGNGFSDGFSALSKRLRFLKFGNLSSPSAKFQRIAEERDEVSRNVPSSTSLHIRERMNRIFSQKIDWNSLGKICKEWIRNPMNLALFIWITCVAVSGAILFMVMVGMLNHAIPKKSQRDIWFEVNNQILNALFTLMCLYQHPIRIYHLALLVRWSPEDVLKLRKVYCKNGTYKPHEWAHMMVVVALLNINCFAQYASCGLNLGYRRSERPAIGVGICISVAIGAPAIAGIYSMLSPLGKDYETELDEEAQLPVTTDGSSRPDQLRRQSLKKRFSFALRDEERNIVSRPLWSGGILDFWDDISLAYLSLFCSFCVFGWNMERLGFGNMYVHIVTFLLFCMAPFWIFNLAAVNIDNDAARAALVVTAVGDFVLWLCCCWCSLAQEARTGNSYDIVEDKFCRRKGDQLPMSPLPREDGEFQFRSSPSSPLGYSSSPSHIMKANSPSPSHFPKEHYSPQTQLSLIQEESLIQVHVIARSKMVHKRSLPIYLVEWNFQLLVFW
ncbi:unnamed protein product [Fraxinus pennsylvanica]|uniref:PLAC8 family protein n=1 Tax=Fraxinus pennsylvanica TaxID=56036 RepID=A0AAD2DRV5_9LAMI|nr:unnamed protein product [Fraxinus pennsylvanica]